MDLEKHRRSNDVGRGNDIISLGMHTRSDYVRCGKPSFIFKSIHDRTTTDMACYHRTLTAHVIGRHWA